VLSLTVANLKMMARNRHTTFWALFFPLLLVVAFGLFDIDGFGSASLAVIDEANTSSSQLLRQKLAGLEFLELKNSPPPAIPEARRMVQAGDLDYLLLIPSDFGKTNQSPIPAITLVYSAADQERNQLVEGAISNLARELALDDSSAHIASSVVAEEINARRASYFDGVLLGLVGLGIMTNSIISIAVKISVYRNQSILKRMLVTPLPIWKYFASEITAHLVLALVQAAIILAVGVFIFGANIYGNLGWIFVIVLLGSLVFLNIGFILSAWANTPSAASGMGNALALPMIFFAGTFFSTASLPWILPQVAQALPLTPMLSALRQVAIDSASIWEVWPQLAIMGAWVVATALAAIKVFRFS
jgi:ABC-2 type transport system permease protein